MKTIFRLFLILALLLVGAGGYYWWNRAEIVSRLLSEQTDMEVSVQDISFSFGGVTLEKFILKDPISETTVHTDKIAVQTTLSSLLANPLRIHRIAIDDLTLNNTLADIDFKDVKSLFKFTKKFKKKKKTKKKIAESTEQKQFIIDQLVADNIVLQVETGKGRPPIRTRIKHFTINNINSGDPVTLHQLVELLSKRLAKESS